MTAAQLETASLDWMKDIGPKCEFLDVIAQDCDLTPDEHILLVRWYLETYEGIGDEASKKDTADELRLHPRVNTAIRAVRDNKEM